LEAVVDKRRVRNLRNEIIPVGPAWGRSLAVNQRARLRGEVRNLRQEPFVGER
jgi:hypothetical protein